MLHFLEMDGYTLVTPGAEDAPAIMRSVEDGRKMNAEYLASLTSPPSGGRLTGSFIYSHPPDYIGRPTMSWGVGEWRALFQELKELGIDTVIYQAAAWAELHECNYPSKVFTGFRTWDSLSPLVEAVAAEGMTFFLGGLGNLTAFDEHATAAVLDADRNLQLACFAELVSLYRGGFHGFYMSPETAFPGARQPAREQLLNRYYSQVCQGVKDTLPGIPILFSPATMYSPGTEQEHHDFLYHLFKGCPVDIIWQQVCHALGCKLWVNVESFERRLCGTAQDFVPADFNRLAVQLANASRVGEKIVSWEVPYFYSSLAGECGIALRRSYLSSL
jgi:hypothetical protein